MKKENVDEPDILDMELEDLASSEEANWREVPEQVIELFEELGLFDSEPHNNLLFKRSVFAF